MNALIDLLANTQDDREYLEVLWSILVSDNLLEKLKVANETDFEAKANLKLLGAVIQRWGDETFVDESEETIE